MGTDLMEVQMIIDPNIRTAHSWMTMKVRGSNSWWICFRSAEVFVKYVKKNLSFSGARNSHKHKWREAEVRAVEKHLIHFIKGQLIPQKIDCVQCLDAEPVALRNRSWKGVKDYIRNRITAVQSGRKGEANDTAASTPAKTKKQRAAPKQRKGGVNEAMPYNNTQIVQQHGTQINTHSK